MVLWSWSTIAVFEMLLHGWQPRERHLEGRWTGGGQETGIASSPLVLSPNSRASLFPAV